MTRSTRTRVLLAAGAALAVAAVPILVLNAQAAVPPTPAGWTQVFADDFNGAANTGVNTANWLYDIGTSYPGGAPTGAPARSRP
jgi:hypothetical protein